MTEKPPVVMFSAGEASGDLHAASLFNALRKKMPEVQGFGMGGANMRAAGIDIRCDSSGLGVIGLIEIAKHYGDIRRALRTMQNSARTERPDLLICVDYKEFNFRLARAAKRAGIKVLFYVSPQVWAWRPGRVKSYGHIIDHMAVIFPFEEPFYREHGIPVTYVGHPLAGKVKPSLDRAEAREKLGLGAGQPVVALLPGSRRNEIKRLLPVILETAQLLSRQISGIRFLLFRAPSVDADQVDAAIRAAGLNLTIIEGQDYDALQCCDAAVTTSGTATLEVALLGVPMAIVYRLTPISYWLGRLLVRIPYIGLPNILAGRHIVREFIQHEASAENIGGEIVRMLRDAEYRDAMIAALAEIRRQLGSRDGSEELARVAVELLRNRGEAQSSPDCSTSGDLAGSDRT